MPTRVSVFGENSRMTLKYTKFIGLVVLSLSFVSGRVETVLPHSNGGRIIKWLAKLSRNLSFIDDGMDTFRDVPKNLDVSLIRDRSKYYSFNYPVSVASWLAGIEIIGACNILELSRDPKPSLNLTEYDFLVIESPGVSVSDIKVNYANLFFIRHPNYMKNKEISKSIDFANGLDCSVEKTITDFRGSVVVGESMAMVFALFSFQDKSKIHIHLKRSSFDNLRCLHDAMSECGVLEIN